MGNCLGSVFRWKKMRRHIMLILIGLDNAGKTKTVNNLVGEKDDKVLPTVGFKAVNLIHKDTPVTIFDLGGGPQFRQIWSQYYSEVHGVIFVIDSSDYSRLDECKAVLEEVLSHDKISGKPILVLANKQDKQGALDDIDIVEKLNIEPLVNKYRCPTLVESYTATPHLNKLKKPKLDPGLKKGYQWLLNYIVRRYGDLNLRVQTDIHLELERRKGFMNKNSNRASQTFTAVSDDIATQTGFENPNYDSLSRKDAEEGVILVKPMNNSRSLDTTATIESVDDSEPTTSAKPKLSPLFGRASDDSAVSAKVELEARREFRKLSPIVRKSIDFEQRPQSSPSTKRSKQSSTSASSSNRNDTSVDSSARKVAVNRVELNDTQIIIADSEYTRASSDVAVTLPRIADAARPASASQIVRRQLEIASHKRRLSLRHIHRNKTSPERLGIFHYEPTQAARDKDCGATHNNLAL